MTFFGLTEATVAPLVRELTRGDLDRDETRQRFARAAWTGISEPGDRVAGALVAALGAAGALEALIARAQPVEFAASVADAGGELGSEELAEGMARWAPRLASGLAVIALQQARRFGVRLVVPGDPEWPIGVDDLGAHAPIALWVRGDPALLTQATGGVALVGARAATGYGEHVTMEASSGLVDRGYAIVSGAAYGIDGMAHRAALASDGVTIAVLAGGLDRFYPSGHEALLTRIVEHGAVVSEVPCGTPPTKWRFLQRNRVIAAMSAATVVLEAGWRSGSLNTAAHASALGRPLGAVPGPVTSSASAGCHRLVREFGATLVTTPDEMAELAPRDDREHRRGDGLGEPVGADGRHPAARGLPPDAIRVLDALSTRAPRDSGDVAARAGLSPAAARATLGMLELDGAVTASAAGWVKRRTPAAAR
ncbi:DNA processing protein [Diaminobutyricimonas aerilata]|uniref:DNA processing protein n=1 Tax=Diaminobutyricimonas aerilata TaxID=1162967 RepID=A0A2M9CIL4_9MICO|nr:DNA-processing protein DprA [Diaminobutyricimonas aerilata]PJJ71776.1 DNA processing protein [Diaminobutyricimonas aerilata]